MKFLNFIEEMRMISKIYELRNYREGERMSNPVGRFVEFIVFMRIYIFISSLVVTGVSMHFTNAFTVKVYKTCSSTASSHFKN